MACLGISSLRDMLSFWVKRLITSDSDQPYTASSNTSLQEGGSPVPHHIPGNLPTVYVPGITVLPSPPRAYSFTTSESDLHGGFDVNGYQKYKLPSFHRTPPLEPPIIFKLPPEHAADRPMNDLCGQVKHFLKYHGVINGPLSMQYMWLYVQYYDSPKGYVGVSPSYFNANVLLQQRLNSIVTSDDWQWLERKHGFKRLGIQCN